MHLIKLEHMFKSMCNMEIIQYYYLLYFRFEKNFVRLWNELHENCLHSCSFYTMGLVKTKFLLIEHLGIEFKLGKSRYTGIHYL